jgi:hypothetical protein
MTEMSQHTQCFYTLHRDGRADWVAHTAFSDALILVLSLLGLGGSWGNEEGDVGVGGERRGL